MINKFIGIDPGQGGGIACLDKNGGVEAIAMPIAGKRIDVAQLSEWIYDRAKKGDAIACLEKVHSMPGQGVSSTFSFGFGTGALYGMLVAMRIPVYEPAPQTWKKLILADTPKDKQAAMDYCARVYPQVSLLATARSKKSHSGIADAICIARYALEKYKDVL
jgi:Holliday junction resolvasome RuvABC endonuclease subunit